MSDQGPWPWPKSSEIDLEKYWKDVRDKSPMLQQVLDHAAKIHQQLKERNMQDFEEREARAVARAADKAREMAIDKILTPSNGGPMTLGPVVSDAGTADANGKFTPTPPEQKLFQDAVTSVLHDVKEMLFEKNRKYGNSALKPTRIFSKASTIEQLKVRIDDKLSRMMSGQTDDTEDVEQDLLGYLVILRAAKLLDSVRRDS